MKKLGILTKKLTKVRVVIQEIYYELPMKDQIYLCEWLRGFDKMLFSRGPKIELMEM